VLSAQGHFSQLRVVFARAPSWHHFCLLFILVICVKRAILIAADLSLHTLMTFYCHLLLSWT